MQTISNIKNVGPATLLKEARKLAKELGTPVPLKADDITEPALVDALLTWLETQK